jgi:hypothetical protein
MIIDVAQHALMITSFVLIMMLIIEYINIQTEGIWQENLRKNRLNQYLLSAFLGLLPGCLGAFTVVSLYSHKMLSFGALAAAMIATSGDEAFIMLAMFPVDALYLNGVLLVVAIFTAYLCDVIFKNKAVSFHTDIHKFELHEEKECASLNIPDIIGQLRDISYMRLILIIMFTLFMGALFFEQLSLSEWNWKKIVFITGIGISLFIVITVPEHFLKVHIYEHVVKKHLLRIFLWTFAALLAVDYIENYINIEPWLQENMTTVLIAASVLGIIPESGPHFVFVTMYAKEMIPFAVLLASSISQDGHGTLPLLAVSFRAFLWLQIVAVTVAIIVGLFFLQFF